MRRASYNAGRFYPRLRHELVSMIEDCFLDKEFGPGKPLDVGGNSDQRRILGGICPHAGYMYSGAAAAQTYMKIFSEKAPDTFIVLGNTHTGYRDIAVMTEGSWETPLGDLLVDSAVAKALFKTNPLFINDDSAFSGFPHGREHNIEVQLPFIKYGAIKADKDIKFVPIKVGRYESGIIKSIGLSIAEVIKGKKDVDIVIIASSDMFHESPRNPSKTKEEIESYKNRGKTVRESIKNMDWESTLHEALKIGSICGPQTISTAMVACKNLGASSSEILTYYTSYEKVVREGPTDYCVAYLSAVFII